MFMIIITGPTSSGKTSLGIKIAKNLNLDIVSVDSRQMYSEFDYGTGKLPVDMFKSEVKIQDGYWEIDGVKIYGYDLFSPNQKATVVDFAVEIYKIIEDLKSKNRKFILIGGTGFYIEFLCWYLEESDKSNIASRVKLDDGEKYQSYSKQELQNLLPAEILSQMNHSDINNKYRLISRLKNIDGKSDISLVDPTDNHQVFVLTSPNEILFKRVDLWVDEIWEKLKTESMNLLDKYPTSPIFDGIIYKTMREFISGDLAESNAIERIKFDLHAYIRRQKTWINRYQQANIIDISSQNIYNTVINKLEKL